MNIKPEILPFILFQRTAYMDDGIISPLMVRLPYFYKSLVNLYARFYPLDVADRYTRDMESEYKTFEKYLPANAGNILDIGCGVAGLDLYIYRKYAGQTNICLLDKTETDRKIHYRYEPVASFYNSLELARDLLVGNGVSADKIKLQSANENNEINFGTQFDVIVSLMSWGFHYPIDTYLDRVWEIMKPGGVLIVDVRKNTDGLKKVRQKFGNAEVIFEMPRLERLCAVKK